MPIPRWQRESLLWLVEQCADTSMSSYADIDLCAVIARQCGWHPLVVNEAMTVHFQGKEYVIQRTK